MLITDFIFMVLFKKKINMFPVNSNVCKILFVIANFYKMWFIISNVVFLIKKNIFYNLFVNKDLLQILRVFLQIVAYDFLFL